MTNCIKNPHMWETAIKKQWNNPFQQSNLYLFLQNLNAVFMPLEKMVQNNYPKGNPTFEGPAWPWLGNGSSNNPTIQASWI